jgi:ribosomal subunit interface protein
MTIPLQISFHGVDRTDTIEDYVRRRADKLASYGRITTCHVAIETPHRHKNHGRHYRVRVDLAIPGSEIVVDRSPDEGRSHEDLYASIDLAFETALRRLRDEMDRRRPARERSEP